MSKNRSTTLCRNCPHQALDVFCTHTADETSFLESFKIGEINLDAGSTVIEQGAASAHIFTVLSGWLFRYKTLEDGQRQILNFAVPGDLVGLQASLMGKVDHGVEALSDVVLCVFEKNRLIELYQSHFHLAFDVTWLACSQERVLDDGMLSLGRRSAKQRVALLLWNLHQNAQRTHSFESRDIVPVTQSHIADAMGFSLVHTNRTLRGLARSGLIDWVDRGFRVRDADSLHTVAGSPAPNPKQRPLV